MRDVTPSGDMSVLQEIFLYLKDFFRNPLKEIRRLPSWNWPRILTMQMGFSILSGALSAIVTSEFSTWKLAQGIFVFPFVATVIGFILASFFYYYFQVFEKRTVPFIKLSTLVFLANTFFYLFHVASGFLAITDILGMAFTGMLLIVGLSDNFSLQKTKSIRLVGALFILIFVIWAFEKIQATRLVRSVNTGTMENL